jgi:hypothetical protein
MRKLEKKVVTAGKEKTLVAWDYDERHYKKLHFLSKEVFDKHGVKVKELQSEWPHISAVYIFAPVTQEERDKLALAADPFKPTFKYKQFALFKGVTAYFFSIEYHVPSQFGEFMDFAGDICGKERIQRYSEDRPHVSLWELSEQEAAKVTKGMLAEIELKSKHYLNPFTPTKLSFWDDFQITRIEQLSSKPKSNFKLAASFKKRVVQAYKVVATDFSDDELKKAIEWMKQVGLTPKGRGKPTKPSRMPSFKVIYDNKDDYYLLVTDLGHKGDVWKIKPTGDSEYISSYTGDYKAKKGQKTFTDANFYDYVELEVIQEILGLLDPEFDDEDDPKHKTMH